MIKLPIDNSDVQAKAAKRGHSLYAPMSRDWLTVVDVSKPCRKKEDRYRDVATIYVC